MCGPGPSAFSMGAYFIYTIVHAAYCDILCPPIIYLVFLQPDNTVFICLSFCTRCFFVVTNLTNHAFVMPFAVHWCFVYLPGLFLSEKHLGKQVKAMDQRTSLDGCPSGDPTPDRPQLSCTMNTTFTSNHSEKRMAGTHHCHGSPCTAERRHYITDTALVFFDKSPSLTTSLNCSVKQKIAYSCRCHRACPRC